VPDPILLRALVEVPAIIAVVRGREHTYEFTNKAYCEVCGFTEAPLGQPWGASITIVDHDRIRALLDRVFTSGEAYRATEFSLRLTRGAEAEVVTAYFDFLFQPLRDDQGAVDGILIHATDVTAHAEERARAEIQREQIIRQREALRVSENHFRRIVESNMCAMAFWDARGAITDANEAFLQLIGASREDVLEGRVDWLKMTPPEFMDVERRAHQELAERGVCTPFEKAYIRTDGTRVPILIGGALFRAPEGSPEAQGGVTFALDITERKKMEASLRETQKLESLGLLAGGVAHDFNNLLTGILANASLAQVESPHPALDDIVKATQRAAALSRQLLAYAGTSSMQPVSLDLSAHVREIAELIRAAVPRKVAVQLDLEPSLPPAKVDPTQFQQVIMNLLINGAEAIPESGGIVKIATKADDQGVSVEISDTGSGMDEAMRSQIFDPFFSTKGKGRGLGLAAVRGIVRAHRGTLTIESTPGQGTTFRIRFPATGTPVPALRRKEEWESFRGRGPVLVVDDEANLRRSASRILEHLGYEVEEAADGWAAIAAYERRANEFAFVLLDLTMPGLGGLEVLRALRRIRADAPVVISSGFSEDNVSSQVDDASVGFLSKPYSVEDLVREIRRVTRV
jgi:PAS domain S-box-containing protein